MSSESVTIGRAPAAKAGAAGGGPGYAEGMLVHHDTYGNGRITEVSGYGALRKVKIRFAAHGEKTFIADKVKLTVVRKA